MILLLGVNHKTAPLAVREKIFSGCQEENNLLISEFTEEEVYEAISQMEHNKAPGPDGFPQSFTNTFGISSKMI